MHNCAHAPKQNGCPEKGNNTPNRHSGKEISYQPNYSYIERQAEQAESQYSQGRGKEFQDWFYEVINQTQNQTGQQKGFCVCNIYSANKLISQPES